MLTLGFHGKEATVEEVCAEVGPGWTALITKLISDLLEVGWDGTIHQVKEKFGGLRFYIGGGTNEIFSLIHEAEEFSYDICEYCGNPGYLRDDLGWILTLCNSCYEKKSPETKRTRHPLSLLLQEKQNDNRETICQETGEPTEVVDP